MSDTTESRLREIFKRYAKIEHDLTPLLEEKKKIETAVKSIMSALEQKDLQFGDVTAKLTVSQSTTYPKALVEKYLADSDLLDKIVKKTTSTKLRMSVNK